MRARRRPLRWSMRRCSPFGTNQRRRRKSFKTPPSITSLLKRRNKLSNDSPSRNRTVTSSHPLLVSYCIFGKRNAKPTWLDVPFTRKASRAMLDTHCIVNLANHHAAGILTHFGPSMPVTICDHMILCDLQRLPKLIPVWINHTRALQFYSQRPLSECV